MIGLLLTAKAAHLVQFLVVAQPATDLQPIFDEYLIWGVDFRAAVDAAAFVAVVWALLGLRVSAASGSFAVAQPPAVDEKVASAASLASLRTS